MNRPEDCRVTGKRFRTAVGFLVFFLPAVSGAADVTVVSPSGPLPRVLSAKGQVHSDAAGDLCDYLSRVTARNIAPGRGAADGAVTIHVGPDEFVLKHVPEIKDLYADGFLLKHLAVDGEQHLVLSGIRLKSSRWAVEEFLMQFAGVRWLFPDTKYGEIVPSKPIVKVDSKLDQKHEPNYLSRSNLGMYYFDKNRKYLRLRPEGGGSFGSHEFQAIFTRKDYEKHPEWFAYFTISDSRVQTLMKGTHPEHAKLRELSSAANDGDGGTGTTATAGRYVRRTRKPFNTPSRMRASTLKSIPMSPQSPWATTIHPAGANATHAGHFPRLPIRPTPYRKDTGTGSTR